jgi:hypothetical protein
MVAEVEAETVGTRPSLRDLASELAGIAARMSAMAARPHLLLERGAFAASQIRTLLEARHKRSAALRLDVVHPGLEPVARPLPGPPRGQAHPNGAARHRRAGKRGQSL